MNINKNAYCKLKTKYHDKMPIVIVEHKGDSILLKMLLNNTCCVRNVKNVLRSNIDKITADKAIFLFLLYNDAAGNKKDVMLTDSSMLQDLHERYYIKNSSTNDGIMYITFAFENAFG